MSLKSDSIQLQAKVPPTIAVKAPGGASDAAPASEINRDSAEFSYVKANEPQGAEKPLRFMGEMVSNIDDIFHTGLTEVAKGGQWLQNSVVARALSWLPQNTHSFFTRVADSKSIGFVQKITQAPFFAPFATFMSKASPIVGLILAPFDIKNCINLWKDPKALLAHKVLTTVRTATGTLMCLGGFLGLVLLPWMGMPTAAAACLSIALKIGLVNLVASVPYWAKGIGSAVGWVGSKAVGLVKKAFSAL